MALKQLTASLMLFFVGLTSTSAQDTSGDSRKETTDSDSDFSMWGFKDKERDDRIRTLRSRSDDELLAAIKSKEAINRETIAELVRRGGSKCLNELQQRYESLRSDREKAKVAEPDVRRSENYELLLLSALNEANNKPDPMPVVIKGESKQTVTFPEMPSFEIAIVNEHPEKRTVNWQEGGNYRHGRRESFGFEVRRDDGRLMPIVSITSGSGGGIISFEQLEKGEEWTNEMPLSSYIKRLPAGKYQVRAAYAFGTDLGMLPDKSGTFMCFSKPVDLVVARRAVRLTPSERTEAEHLCHALPKDGPVKVVEGGYNKKRDGSFIAPESTPGQLLELGWKAVPSLIALLEEKTTKPVERAWAIALLYSITGENDPLGENEIGRSAAMIGSALGPCEVKKRGWAVLDGKGVGGLSPAQTASYTGKILEQEQAELSKQWTSWKKNIDVLDSKESAK